jgi:carboxyl-terminal processing protease
MKLAYKRLRTPKAFVGILISALLGAWCIANSRSAEPGTPLSTAERAAVLDEVWQLIADNYYDPHYNGVDWKAVRSRYRRQVDEVASEAAFYALLNRMTGELRDAHTRVRTPQQAAARRKRERTGVGVLIYEVEGTPVIFAVTAGSEAARAGVRPGMIVRTVDGRPIHEALAAAREEVGASSSARAARILSYLKLIEGAAGTSLKLGLTGTDGAPLEVVLARISSSAKAQVSARLLPSGVAYIGVERFRSPASDLVKDALTKFKSAPGVILDLRANTGGDGKEGLRVAGYFFDRKVPIARVLTRTGKPPSAFFGLVKLPMVLEAGERGRQLTQGRSSCW